MTNQYKSHFTSMAFRSTFMEPIHCLDVFNRLQDEVEGVSPLSGESPLQTMACGPIVLG